MPASEKQSASPPPTEAAKPAQPEPPAPEPPDLWKLVQAQVWKRFGLVGVASLAGLGICLSLWYQWDHISKLPGIEPLVSRISERALPKAVPGKFNIAVAHLEGDDKHETERLIRESLAEFPGVATLSFDRLIALEQGDSEKAEREGHERARTLLKTSGADVLIWGIVLKQGGKSLPKLYWTPSRAVAHTPAPGRYQTAEDLRLPSIFWQDLTNVLALLIATGDAEFATHAGQYTADTLDPFIKRVSELLRSSTAEKWNAATRAEVLSILGNALDTYGVQKGSNKDIRDAIDFHVEALRERTREKAPLDWAKSQYSLGNALVDLGEREHKPAQLNEAVTAYREALKEFTREKAPLDWARTQNALGTALQTKGGREHNSALLTEAVDSFREALKERTREKVPLDWARTQNNLGNALQTLGGPSRLTEAMTAYREALKELTRERVPLDWALTQNNLGVALQVLGERESDPALLTVAVDTFREALKERTREKVPSDWAKTQVNLGNALHTLGKVKSDPARLEEAASAYQAALPYFRSVNDDSYIRLVELLLWRVRTDIGQQKNAKSVVPIR